MQTNTSTDRRATANSTFAIGGVSCSAENLVVAESFVLRINIGGKKPAHRKSAKRWLQGKKNRSSMMNYNIINNRKTINL